MPSIREDVIAAAEAARLALGDRRAGVDFGWIRRLTAASGERIGNVVAEIGEMVSFEERIRAELLLGGRPHYAQFRAPFELYAFVRLTQPEHVLETGVSSGVSSAHLLLAVRRNGHGHVHSIDRPLPQQGPRIRPGESRVAIPPGRASGWAVPAEVRAGWDLRVGPSEQLLPPLVDDLPSVGLFLHDSWHTPKHLTFELTTVRPKLVPGAIVLADNTEWTGTAFPRFARQVGAPVVRRGRSDLVGLALPRS